MRPKPIVYLLEEDLMNAPDHPELMDEAQSEQAQDQFPPELSVLPLRNTVLFPGVVMPITVARDKGIALVKDAAQRKQKLVGVVAQREGEVEDPTPEQLHSTGTVAAILRTIRIPDGSITVVIQGRTRIGLQEYTQQEPFLKARFRRMKDDLPAAEEAKALMLNLKKEAERFIELSPGIPSEANITLQNINSLSYLVYFIAANLNIGIGEKQEILEETSLRSKAERVLEHLAHELQVLEITEEISTKVRHDIDKAQRDFILRQQMKSIQEELDERNHDDELEQLRQKAAKKVWSAETQEAFEKELNKLYRTNPGSPEYAVTSNYLDVMLDLPWRKYSKDRLDLERTRKLLDAEHEGLETVKERILQYLAVLKLKQDLKAPILCFYGPPGVGKTSLGRSIAKALGREFVRLSLGGVRDEAEVRGHRRTYIGAMPGRILQSLRKAKKGNPVFVLDEIDKLGADFRGDPQSALLEVLDPEQNTSFSDHYLELPYDLSPILFVATANSLDSLHPALRDRLEIIEINGYTQQEKLAIATRHLVPRVLKDHGLKPTQLKFTDEALHAIIDQHTRESGVRQLQRKLAEVCRSLAPKLVAGTVKRATITPQNLPEYLGRARFHSDAYQRVEAPGVAIGLAWTPVGGEILFIETALSPGHGRLRVTGQLGEVMQESAQLAYTWLKVHAEAYQIPASAFDLWDVHLHIPAGAVPKEGPSAGAALLVALASAFTQRKARPALALTGEITLRGKLLPVGGIKEKVLAAKRAGIREVVLSRENEKDVQDIRPAHLLEGLSVTYLDSMQEVLSLALEAQPTTDALQFAPKPVAGLRAG